MTAPNPISLEGEPVQRGASLFDLPTFIATLVICGLVTVFEMFVVPGFQAILKDFHARIPGITRLVIDSSYGFKHGAWGVFAAIPVVLPVVVAGFRKGQPPTAASTRTAIRATILLFVVLAVIFGITFGIPVFSLSASISGH